MKRRNAPYIFIYSFPGHTKQHRKEHVRHVKHVNCVKLVKLMKLVKVLERMKKLRCVKEIGPMKITMCAWPVKILKRVNYMKQVKLRRLANTGNKIRVKKGNKLWGKTWKNDGTGAGHMWDEVSGLHETVETKCETGLTVKNFSLMWTVSWIKVSKWMQLAKWVKWNK